MGDIAVNLLVDTGVAITLMSSAVFERVDLPDADLEQVECNICTADGTPIRVHGERVMQLTIGSLRVEHPVIVADIKVDLILGMDFLKNHDCKVDIAGQKLSIDKTIVEGE